MVLSIYQNLINRRFFQYDTVILKQFVHWYNHTWTNSRAIEIPIFLEILKRCAGERVLEVGNVLSHYTKKNHVVLDKYEKGSGIINEDVVDYKPVEKYDLVVSCSTLEHVGFDEECKDSFKFIKAIENLRKNVVKEDGCIVFSVPIGYNPGLDKILRVSFGNVREEGVLLFHPVSFFKAAVYKRDGLDWIVSSWDLVKYSRMGDALLIGVVKK
jgi:SAM-dependent methyltransferase